MPNPDVLLREIMALARHPSRRDDGLAARVRELDGWLHGGGYLPTVWALALEREVVDLPLPARTEVPACRKPPPGPCPSCLGWRTHRRGCDVG